MSYKVRYKFLRLDNHGKIKSQFGNLEWKVNEWNKVDPDRLKLCHHGLHCSVEIGQAYSYIQGDVLAKVEVRGSSLSESDKEAWSEMKIVKAYKWTSRDSVQLAIFAAEQVIDIYEKHYPEDKRPRNAIEVAKRVLKDSSAADAADAALAARAAAYAARAAADAADAAYAADAAAAALAADAARAAADAADAAYAADAAAGHKMASKIEKWMNNHVKELKEINGGD